MNSIALTAPMCAPMTGPAAPTRPGSDEGGFAALVDAQTLSPLRQTPADPGKQLPAPSATETVAPPGRQSLDDGGKFVPLSLATASAASPFSLSDSAIPTDKAPAEPVTFDAHPRSSDDTDETEADAAPVAAMNLMMSPIYPALAVAVAPPGQVTAVEPPPLPSTGGRPEPIVQAVTMPPAALPAIVGSEPVKTAEPLPATVPTSSPAAADLAQQARPIALPPGRGLADADQPTPVLIPTAIAIAISPVPATGAGENEPVTSTPPATPDAPAPIRQIAAANPPLLPAPSISAAAAPPPVLTPPPAGPAAQVFAAALHAASDDELKPRQAAPALTAATMPEWVREVAAAPASPAIDLSNHRWPAQMIERIEALRDDADATSTRVRFAPDTLGAVDLRMRHEGDAVHLRFTAAEPATRALLQNAQPELARLAAERGVRLGGSSVDAGDQPAPRQPPAPTRFTAPAAAPDEVADDDDIRIA